MLEKLKSLTFHTPLRSTEIDLSKLGRVREGVPEFGDFAALQMAALAGARFT